LLIGGHLGGVHLSAVEIINATMNMLYKYLSPYYILAIMLVFLVHKSSLHVIYFDLPWSWMLCLVTWLSWPGHKLKSCKAIFLPRNSSPAILSPHHCLTGILVVTLQPCKSQYQVVKSAPVTTPYIGFDKTGCFPGMLKNKLRTRVTRNEWNSLSIMSAGEMLPLNLMLWIYFLI
jgi:hypothetical protein